MSLDIMLIKTSDGSFKPATLEDLEACKSLKIGKEFGCTLTQLRNGKFHRKLFSLLKFAYDNSERVTSDFDGEKVEQSFTRFRQDLVILAGYYDVDVAINGDVRATAQSLQYGKCTQELAEAIYSDVLDVICQKVFSDGRYTRESLLEISEELTRYAA